MRASLMLNAGIIGVGGFAGSHHEAIRALEAEGECRLLCGCDPDASLLASARTRYGLDERGVQVFPDYRAMLDACGDRLDVVTIPTPIPFHEEMHAACAEKGLAVYLEKPPTLDPEELERMIAATRKSGKETNVGFNFILEAPRQALKRRMLNGEFGQLKRISLLGLWPRSTAYFTRSAWAGKLLWPNGRLVLDSCIGNAMAHYVHNLFHWAGTKGPLDWASPRSIEAELYRAHDIESFDAVFLRGEIEGAVELRLAVSHDCDGEQNHREELHFEDATLTYVTWGGWRLRRSDGTEETGPADRRDLLMENLREYLRYVRGDAERPLNRLEDSRPFVHLNDLAFLSSEEITPLDSSFLRRSTANDGGTCLALTRLDEAAETFVSTGAFPAEQGMPWARKTPPGTARPDDLPRLRATVQAMADASR